VTATSVAPLGNIDRASVVTILNNAVVQYINTPGEYTLKDGKGIILIVTGGVTLTGTTSADILITPGADNGTIDFKAATVTGKITVQADNATVDVDEDSNLPEINFTGTGSKVEEETTEQTHTSTNTSSVTPSNNDSVPVAYTATIKNQDEANALSKTVKYSTITISEELGENEVTLDGIQMDDLVINGGGDNSVYLKGCKVNKNVSIKKEFGKPLHLVLLGTPVPNVDVNTSAILEADENSEITKVIASADITVKGEKTVLTDIEVPASATAKISVTEGAAVDQLTVKGNAELAEGTIAKVVIPEDADNNVTFTVAKDASVTTTVVNKGGATITGNAGNVTTEREDDIAINVNGVSATINKDSEPIQTGTKVDDSNKNIIDDDEEEQTAPVTTITVGDKNYLYDDEEEEYYIIVGDGDEREYIGDLAELIDIIENTKVDNGELSIIVNNKKYYYDADEKEWIDSDEKEAVDLEVVIGGTNSSDDLVDETPTEDIDSAD
jgi:Fe-S cluster assembly iron-binding protein IscA